MLCCITLLAESFLGDSQKPCWIGIGSLSEWRWPRTLLYTTGTKIGECHVRLPYTLLAVGTTTTTTRRRRRRYKQKLQPRARHNISSSFVSARGWKQKLQRRRCFLIPPENNQPTSMRTSSGSDSSTSASGSSTSAIMVVVLVAVKLLLRASTTS